MRGGERIGRRPAARLRSGSTGAWSHRASRDTVPWGDVHVWFGDDRYVPRDHPYSNVKPFDDIVLGIAGAEEGTAGGGNPVVPIPLDHVHPYPTGEAIGAARGPEWCAAMLADELRQAPLERVGGWPAFDLMLLGIGADAHILSVFPGSEAFESQISRWPSRHPPISPRGCRG